MKTTLIPLVLTTVLLASANSGEAQTAPFTYQGRLTTNGTAAGGTYDFTFGLCTNLSLGSPAGTVLTNGGIVVSNGVFTTTLSFTNNFDGTAYWLEIGVRATGGGAFTTLSPRQALTPTPYAISASDVTGPVPAGQLTGSLPAGILASLYATAVDFTNAGSIFNGNGSGLTNLPAAQLTGTVPDARLSTNVALLNGTNQPGKNVVFGVPVAAIVTGGTNYGLIGVNNTADGTSTGGGVYGQTTQSSGFGVFAQNKDAAGTAIIAAGNNQTGLVVPNGSGLAAYGLFTAIYAQANANSSSFTALNTYLPAVNNQVLVNYYSGSVVYKIAGSGTVSTLVADAANTSHVMFAPEAPEVLFEDYGSGQLTNGSAHISLDPILSANIAVSTVHPLRVFVQLEGDCKGVYVANKSAAGFDVIELNGGASNVPFSWHVTANRADEVQNTATKAPDGSANPKFVSHYSSQRFPQDPNLKTSWHASKAISAPQK